MDRETKLLYIGVRFLAIFGFLGILIGANIDKFKGQSEDSIIIEIVLSNHKFEPAIINIKGEKSVILNIKNLDNSAEEFESNSLKREKIIGAQSTAQVKLGKLAKGTYEFEGEFNPATAQGKIIVE